MAAQEDPSNSPTQQPAKEEDADLRAWMDDHDLRSNYCKLYAVFCTADIPPHILDSFITQVRDSYPPDGGCAVCVITPSPGSKKQPTATDFAGGTRAPNKAFQTPFRDKSIKELREIFVRDFGGEEGWAEHCFAVVDKRSVDDKTVFLVSVDPEDAEESTQVLNHRCEFRITLDLLIGYEVEGLGIDNHAEGSEEWDWVYTSEDFEKSMGAA
jgi:hypothetical protein